jgi:hypothetical protein
MVRAAKLREVRLAERRAEVLRRYRAGEKQSSIARQLGLSEMAVSRDLARVTASWKASAVRDLQAEKGRLLSELEGIRREALAAWERSKAEGQTASITRRKVRVGRRVFGPDGGDDGDERLVDDCRTEQVTRTQRDGDPRFLSVALQTLSQEADVLGLKATGEPATNPVVVGFRLNLPPGYVPKAPVVEGAVAVLPPRPPAQPGPVYGLRKLPEGADPAEWEQVEEDEHGTRVAPQEEGPGPGPGSGSGSGPGPG